MPRSTIPARAVSTMTPSEAIIRGIRKRAEHNTTVAILYGTNPAAFASLTVAKLVTVYNALASLCGLDGIRKTDRLVMNGKAVTVKRSEEELRGLIDTGLPTLQGVMKSWAKGQAPRFVWVHQTFEPLPLPGNDVPMLPLGVAYARAIEQGAINPPTDYVEACKEAVEEEEILQRPAFRGFVLAVKEDADAQPKRAKTAKTATTFAVADNF